MSKRRGLGRGLDALLESRPEAAKVKAKTRAKGRAAGPGVRMVSVESLTANRLQPRHHFDDAQLEELAESIRNQGIIQPLIVVEEEGGLSLVAGERRLRAAQLAGLTEVPVFVREVEGDQQLLELALVENLQRSDLNPVEEAQAYHALREEFALSQDEIARRVGKNRSTVTNTLRLLRLPDEVLALLREGRLSAGQARPLLSLRTRAQQISMARRVAREQLPVRVVEALVASPQSQAKKKAGKAKADVHTRAAVERLTRALQTKVDIRRRGKGGVLQVHFHSEEELMRLYDLMMGEN